MPQGRGEDDFLPLIPPSPDPPSPLLREINRRIARSRRLQLRSVGYSGALLREILQAMRKPRVAKKPKKG